MRRWYWILDSLVMVSFVVIGRDSHGFISDASDIARVAAPFLLALALGSVVFKAWMRPGSWLTGLSLGVTTLVVGMVLRRMVFDAGTAPTFVVVTGAWLVGLMVGWRIVATLISRLRTTGAT